MVNNDRRQREDDAADQAPSSQQTSTKSAPGTAKARGDPNHENPEPKGERQLAYETWTRERLYAHARNLGIKRRSSMNKQQLIDALRKGFR